MECREVKFRAWYPGDSQAKPYMEYDFLVSSFEGHIEDGDGEERVIYGNKMVLMQYTGLKDHNGTEIYEGDIIEHGNGDRFRVEPLAPPRKEMYYEYEHYDDFLSMSDVDYEVVGNIYQNPGMLQ